MKINHIKFVSVRGVCLGETSVVRLWLKCRKRILMIYRRSDKNKKTVCRVLGTQMHGIGFNNLIKDLSRRGSALKIQGREMNQFVQGFGVRTVYLKSHLLCLIHVNFRFLYFIYPSELFT